MFVNVEFLWSKEKWLETCCFISKLCAIKYLFLASDHRNKIPIQQAKNVSGGIKLRSHAISIVRISLKHFMFSNKYKHYHTQVTHLMPLCVMFVFASINHKTSNIFKQRKNIFNVSFWQRQTTIFFLLISISIWFSALEEFSFFYSCQGWIFKFSMRYLWGTIKVVVPYINSAHGMVHIRAQKLCWKSSEIVKSSYEICEM